MNPADRAHDSNRVVDLAAYRREKFNREAMEMTAPGPSHPASRAIKAKEEKRDFIVKDGEFQDEH